MIEKMKQKLRIIKIGGNVINDPGSLQSFLEDFAALEGMKILVHGGGKKATEVSEALGLQTTMIGGRRVTDTKGLEVVAMVYAGLLNKNIVAGLQALQCNALGLSGADANSVLAHKRPVENVDYGFAGDVDAVNARAIDLFLQGGLTPVFCAITHDAKGQLLNTNADTIAGELAAGLSGLYEVELIYCFEKKGVLLDMDDPDSVVEHMDSNSYARLQKEGVIVAGMLPKLKNCFEALHRGTARVVVGSPGMLRDREMKFTTITL